MSERVFPPTRDDHLGDYAEIISYGVSHEDAARRLGVAPEQMNIWLRSAETVTRRHLISREVS